MGIGDDDSYAFSIAGPDHWPLADCIAMVSESKKRTGSTQGHALAPTSPLQAARLADTPRRLDVCRQAILDRDFDALASIVELDSDVMHAVMMTSTPPLHYAAASAGHERGQGVASRWLPVAPPSMPAPTSTSFVLKCTDRNRSRCVASRRRAMLTAGVGGPALVEDSTK
jgi:hypothetical protein